ncbi:MAG TPA: 6-phosphofructokinase [Acidimicrobiales bacterium]|nr:6-phosphofructokinase [Acidimicrobiales bacterium]
MHHSTRIGVLTSGGDAQGMNAAIRAVTRTALSEGVDVFAISEGYAGMVAGGDNIFPLRWEDVSGILQLGGTVIGTARSAEFREREGRLRAAANLLEVGIDRLVVIGGDGSLTGANMFREEWPGLLAELVESGEITADAAAAHPVLHVVGLVGSIDNDMRGTDMTIGADSALHRIIEAIDAIGATAASHQRSFVIEVMGRRCGYLALRGAIAGGADWVFIPESPPKPGWERQMTEALSRGRRLGRRDSIVVVSEGAVDEAGRPITSEQIRGLLEAELGEDTRVTVLGHVQRGGAPTAFDRYMSTILGAAAVGEVLDATADSEPQLIGLRNNRVTKVPLMQAVEATHAIADAMAEGDYARALELRGGSFRESFEILKTLTRLEPSAPFDPTTSKRVAIVHSGAPAAGMNPTVRVATRLLIDRGHQVLGVRNGFEGLIEPDLVELDWMSVAGWASHGGAELGVTRTELEGPDLYNIARTIEQQKIDALWMIGGWSGYVGCHRLFSERRNFPAFELPILCLPASIDNNLPGSESSIGADTALNNIIEAVDRIKQSATASGRCFVVEVMGRYCGYLALMGGLASGAERVLLNETGVSLAVLQEELAAMIERFESGSRLSLIMRNERASKVYTTGFIRDLLEEEGGDLFSVRQAILGHQQQGGDPSPFDRILATRLASRSVDRLIEAMSRPDPPAEFIGISEGHVRFTGFEDFDRLVDHEHQRPKVQWWMDLRDITHRLAHQRATHPQENT